MGTALGKNVIYGADNPMHYTTSKTKTKQLMLYVICLMFLYSCTNLSSISSFVTISGLVGQYTLLHTFLYVSFREKAAGSVL